MSRLELIESLISEEADLQKLKKLNRAWWQEKFRLEREEIKAMVRDMTDGKGKAA